MMIELKKITLYKIKPNLDFNNFLKGNLSQYDHFKCANNTYEGYIKYFIGGGNKKDETQIPWLKFLNTAFTQPKYTYEAYNKFPRAILALKVIFDGKAYYYVATFGQHGDVFLDKDQVVHDFGIKVAMNICDVEKLRHVQTTIHESISQQTERQASIGARLSVFNINNETEFLRTISGYVNNTYADLIDSFRGKDSIALKFPQKNTLTWESLIAICKKMENRYQSTDYTNTEFKIYDLLKHVNDPQLIEKLDNIVCEKIKNQDFLKIHLSPPEFLHDEFSYTYKEKREGEKLEIYDELVIDKLVIQPRRRLEKLRKSTLKSWKIYKYDYEQDQTFQLWDAYQCLVAEIDFEQKTYVLSNAIWREVSEELKNQITSYFQRNDLNFQIDYLMDNISIYDTEKGANREEVYNSYVASNSDNIYLFDKAKLTVSGTKRYEICDLLTKEKHLIHVKRYTSGAASISHLFIQAKFYSHAFSTEKSCRKDMRDWIDSNITVENKNKDKAIFKELIPEENSEVKNNEYSVIFCILHNMVSFDLSHLPLMSQYELMNSHRYLTEDKKFKCGIVYKKINLTSKISK